MTKIKDMIIKESTSLSVDASKDFINLFMLGIELIDFKGLRILNTLSALILAVGKI